MKSIKTAILLIGLICCCFSCKKDKIDPPTVKVFDGAITIDYTKASVSAEVTDQGGAEVKSRGIVYGRSGALQDTVFCGSGTGVFSAELAGLEPNVTYTYEAFARNAGGVGLSGKVTFTTKELSSPKVKTLEVSEVTTTTAVCRGKVTEEGGAAVTKRGACWSKSHNPTIGDGHVESGEGVGEYTCELTGLEANTTYYVRAYATNSKGTGYGEELTLTMKEEHVVSVSVYPAGSGEVTVSGGGVVFNGNECTVTATAKHGYQFNRWTENGNEVSTEPSYTFTVTGNRTLVAVFVIDIPTGAINGFSVSATQQVWFSRGNLQYQASTNTWRFAENQWDYVGSANSNISQNYSGWIDLFGWGTSGYNHGTVCYQPWSTSTSYSDYYAYGSYNYNLYDQTGQADWGYNSISNGGNTIHTWRTLTYEEWYYLFYTRSTNSGIRYAKAKVNDINGVILLPDDWSDSYYALSNTNQSEASISSNVITASQWNNILEQYGAVFLPAAGFRSGTSVYNIGSYGYYWSASYASGGSYSYGAWKVTFTDSFLGIGYNNDRYRGRSVRLVRVAQ